MFVQLLPIKPPLRRNRLIDQLTNKLQMLHAHVIFTKIKAFLLGVITIYYIYGRRTNVLSKNANILSMYMFMCSIYPLPIH